jgi:hypothetical protein
MEPAASHPRAGSKGAISLYFVDDSACFKNMICAQQKRRRKSLATALSKNRFASGLLPNSYTTSGETTPTPPQSLAEVNGTPRALSAFAVAADATGRAGATVVVNALVSQRYFCRDKRANGQNRQRESYKETFHNKLLS